MATGGCIKRLISGATCTFLFGLFFIFCLLNPVALAASSPYQSDDSDTGPIRELAQEGITTPASHWHIYYKDGLHIESARKYLRMKVNALLMIDGGYIGADDELSEAFPELEGWKAELRRLELSMLGWISDFVDFKLQIDFANVKAIKDNWIGLKVPLLGHIKAGT